jgi:hypothetical protein
MSWTASHDPAVPELTRPQRYEAHRLRAAELLAQGWTTPRSLRRSGSLLRRSDAGGTPGPRADQGAAAPPGQRPTTRPLRRADRRDHPCAASRRHRQRVRQRPVDPRPRRPGHRAHDQDPAVALQHLAAAAPAWLDPATPRTLRQRTRRAGHRPLGHARVATDQKGPPSQVPGSSSSTSPGSPCCPWSATPGRHEGTPRSCATPQQLETRQHGRRTRLPRHRS